MKAPLVALGLSALLAGLPPATHANPHGDALAAGLAGLLLGPALAPPAPPRPQPVQRIYYVNPGTTRRVVVEYGYPAPPPYPPYGPHPFAPPW
jgi:hypothetical protein